MRGRPAWCCHNLPWWMHVMWKAGGTAPWWSWKGQSGTCTGAWQQSEVVRGCIYHVWHYHFICALLENHLRYSPQFEIQSTAYLDDCCVVLCWLFCRCCLVLESMQQGPLPPGLVRRGLRLGWKCCACRLLSVSPWKWPMPSLQLWGLLDVCEGVDCGWKCCRLEGLRHDRLGLAPYTAVPGSFARSLWLFLSLAFLLQVYMLTFSVPCFLAVGVHVGVDEDSAGLPTLANCLIFLQISSLFMAGPDKQKYDHSRPPQWFFVKAV